MLLTEYVTVNWSTTNRDWLQAKGYVLTKLKDPVTIKVEDCTPKSFAKVKYKCDYCGSIIETTWYAYTQLRNNELVNKDTCRKCAKLKHLDNLDVKQSLGILQKTDFGYWTFKENRLKELRIFLDSGNNLENLYDTSYSDILSSVQRKNDNLLDLVIELGYDLRTVTNSLSNLDFWLKKDHIVMMINNFIKENGKFPTLNELFADTGIKYNALVRFGGFNQLKKEMGFPVDDNLLQNFDSVENLRLYSNTSGIYQVMNIKNGKTYIGQAMNLWERIRAGYLKGFPLGKCHNKHLQRAWNKDGGENFVISVLETCDKDKLNEREQYWLDYYQSYNNKYGYNICPVAGSNLGYVMSEQTKEKIRRNHVNNMKGKHHTEKVKQLLSAQHSVAIVQLDLNGNYIREWPSIKVASDAFNTPRSNISGALRRRHLSAVGSLWVYADDYHNGKFDLKELLKIDGTRRRVAQLTLTDELIRIWPSVSEASKSVNMGNVRSICDGLRDSICGYKWMYVEDYNVKFGQQVI